MSKRQSEDKLKELYAQAAKSLYGKAPLGHEGPFIEFDEDPAVSLAEDEDDEDGAWVRCWIFIDRSDVEE